MVKKNTKKEVPGWYTPFRGAKHAHYVTTSAGELLGSAICGACCNKKEGWLPIPGELVCSKCLEIVRLREDLSKSILMPFEETSRCRVEEMSDSNPVSANHTQGVGEEIPLCQIPVADVQTVMRLLYQYLPVSTLRASRSQVRAVINSLNEYVGEALDRNAKSNENNTVVSTGFKKNRGGGIEWRAMT